MELAASKRMNEVLQQQLAGMKEEARAEADAKAALERSSALELSDWIAANGGLNRINLTSDDWHAKPANSKAASHLFSFLTWGETKVHLECF